MFVEDVYRRYKLRLWAGMDGDDGRRLPSDGFRGGCKGCSPGWQNQVANPSFET